MTKLETYRSGILAYDQQDSGVSRADMLDQAESRKPLVTAVELPPFPAVAIRALRLASNSDIRLRELHEVICADQVFSTELLKLANSPLHAISTPIRSTIQATILLGYARVKALILTIGVRVYLANVLEIPALRACWRHSLACAIVAEDLAVASFSAKSAVGGHLDKDVAYTAGIIHDLGRLALAVLRPRDYADFLKSTEQEPCGVLEQERQLFGIDHCQAGGLLVADWNLPGDFIEITSQHHTTVRGRPFGPLAAVHFSCMMADVLGFQAAYSTKLPRYEELCESLPESERQHFGASRDEYALRIASKIEAIETV